MERFRTRSVFQSAWKLLKTNIKFLALAILGTGVIIAVLQILPLIAQDSIVAQIIISVIQIFIGIAITLGWIQAILKLIRTGSKDWNNFATTMQTWKRYIIAYILQILAVFFAILALLIPIMLVQGIFRAIVGVNIPVIIMVILFVGVFFAVIFVLIRTLFIPHVAIDHPEFSGLQVFKHTFRMTRGHEWRIVRFGILGLFINLLGLIALVVGLLVTAPTTYIANVYLYEHVRSGKDSEEIIASNEAEATA